MELEVKDRGPNFEFATNAGIEEMGINIKDMLPNLFGGKTRKRKMRVAEAPITWSRKKSRSSSTWTR